MVNVAYSFWLILIVLITRNSTLQDHSYLSSPVCQEIIAYDAALKKEFLKIVNKDKHLPDTDKVAYQFVNSYITTRRESEVLSKEDFRTGNFLYKIELAELG